MKDDFLQHFVLAKCEYSVIECTLTQYKPWHILKYIHSSGSCTMFILYTLLAFRLYICVIYIYTHTYTRRDYELMCVCIYIYIYIYIMISMSDHSKLIPQLLLIQSYLKQGCLNEAHY